MPGRATPAGTRRRRDHGPVGETKTNSLFSVAPPPVEWYIAFATAAPLFSTTPAVAAIAASDAAASTSTPR